ncbi:MAG: squalene/phytoene synthase family protein [Rhodospirillaceae bacterium]|nr:squalene/phytoene synthase family protein [Rhodospirillaceae bacterium]
MRRLDRDRYLTALLAPASRREDLFTIYALNAELSRVPESVREPLVGRIRLQWWREGIAAALRGEAPRHPVLAALAEAARRHALPWEPLERLVETREEDLEPGPPPTMTALLAYADGTAAAVMSLALAVLGAGPDAEAVVRAGRALGQAWALVGLLRALPFHARLRRRLYLPTELLARHSIRQRDVLELRPSAALARAVEEVAGTARTRLAEARAVTVPRPLLSPFLLAPLAEQHLGRLARAGYDVFDPRVAAAPPGRLWRLLPWAWSGRF